MFRIGITLPRARASWMFRGGFACLNAVQNMSGERQWKRVKRSRAFLNIEAKWVGAHLGKGNRSISSSKRLLFRLFDFFGAFLLDLVTVELEGAGLGFPALFLLFASFICWTIIGIGAFYVFLYFIGTLRFGYSFLLACTDFFIFFARTLSFARINVVTMLRNKPGKGDSFLISVSLTQL